jgi:hypothetical protein
MKRLFAGLMGLNWKLEAASGFEPLHRGFADLSLNHLGTPPFSTLANMNFPRVSRKS